MIARALTLALAGLALAGPAHAATPSSIASAAAGRPVVVTCDTAPDADEAGSTVVGSSSISTTPSACAALARLGRGDVTWLKRSTDGVENVDVAGAAVQMIVHEATHLALSSGDEALVECTASRNYWPAIAGLHLPARQAGRLLRAAERTHRNLKSAHYKETC